MTKDLSHIQTNVTTLWNIMKDAGCQIIRTTLGASVQNLVLSSLTSDGSGVATGNNSSTRSLGTVGSTMAATIAGATPTAYNGTVTITVTGTNMFTHPIAAGVTASATGTLTAGNGYATKYLQMPSTANWENGGQRDQLNAWFKSQASAGTMLAMADTITAMVDPSDNALFVTAGVAGGSTTDGLHPGYTQRERMAAIVRSVIQPLT